MDVLYAIRRYMRLGIEFVRLSAAEKLTLLLAAISFWMVVFVIGSFALIFFSVGIVQILSLSIPEYLTYVIAGIFYLLLLLLLIVFKRVIIINPIARFISRLIVGPTETN